MPELSMPELRCQSFDAGVRWRGSMAEAVMGRRHGWLRAPALMVGFLILAACSGPKPLDETTGLPPPVATTGPTGPVGPLTGLPIDPARAGRPLLVVKVDNAPKARPQMGLGAADVVVEEEVEGGVTRFAALFHSLDAPAVGPVRSARSTDILFATALNRPLFAYSGANSAFQGLIARAPLVDVGVDRFPGDYRRQAGRPAPYNQFSSTPALASHAPSGASPPPPLFPFRRVGEPTDAAGAAPTAGLNVEYRDVILTAVQYLWDAPSGTWKRNQSGSPHVDQAGLQFAPRNVVVQFVNYRDTGSRDQSGAAVPEAELVGEGEAWVFTDGKVVRGRWRKAGPGAVTEYLDASGAPVRMTPGQTWIELPRPGKAAPAP
jgi:Protein of unknown function (DUF3048) N-terminal domain/Protein of unknown function (DUF3048) C-terminal domain